jgi:putative endonuclease
LPSRLHKSVVCTVGPREHCKNEGRLGLHYDESTERDALRRDATNLARRAWEHRNNVADGFTKQYGLHRLVYAQRHEDILAAKQRERNIKHWSRAWKVQLIRKDNPNWDDLYDILT